MGGGVWYLATGDGMLSDLIRAPNEVEAGEHGLDDFREDTRCDKDGAGFWTGPS